MTNGLNDIPNPYDQITRLRAEVEVWKNHTKTAIWADSELCKFLTAENARLREALEKVAALGNVAAMVPGPRNKIMEICNTARAALAPPEKETEA